MNIYDNGISIGATDVSYIKSTTTVQDLCKEAVRLQVATRVSNKEKAAMLKAVEEQGIDTSSLEVLQLTKEASEVAESSGNPYICLGLSAFQIIVARDHFRAAASCAGGLVLGLAAQTTFTASAEMALFYCAPFVELPPVGLGIAAVALVVGTWGMIEGSRDAEQLYDYWFTPVTKDNLKAALRSN